MHLLNENLFYIFYPLLLCDSSDSEESNKTLLLSLLVPWKHEKLNSKHTWSL